MENDGRYVGDTLLYPVDRIAKWVTQPGPKWCTPETRPIFRERPVAHGDGRVDADHLYSLCFEIMSKSHKSMFARVLRSMRRRHGITGAGKSKFPKKPVRVAIIKVLLGIEFDGWEPQHITGDVWASTKEAILAGISNPKTKRNLGGCTPRQALSFFQQYGPKCGGSTMAERNRAIKEIRESH